MEPAEVETYDCMAYIIGEGELSFKFNNSDIKIKCKHVHEFKENVLSLSNMVKIFDIQFVNDRQFEE